LLKKNINAFKKGRKLTAPKLLNRILGYLTATNVDKCDLVKKKKKRFEKHKKQDESHGHITPQAPTAASWGTKDHYVDTNSLWPHCHKA